MSGDGLSRLGVDQQRQTEAKRAQIQANKAEVKAHNSFGRKLRRKYKGGSISAAQFIATSGFDLSTGGTMDSNEQVTEQARQMAADDLDAFGNARRGGRAGGSGGGGGFQRQNESLDEKAESKQRSSALSGAFGKEAKNKALRAEADDLVAEVEAKGDNISKKDREIYEKRAVALGGSPESFWGAVEKGTDSGRKTKADELVDKVAEKGLTITDEEKNKYVAEAVKLGGSEQSLFEAVDRKESGKPAEEEFTAQEEITKKSSDISNKRKEMIEEYGESAVANLADEQIAGLIDSSTKRIGEFEDQKTVNQRYKEWVADDREAREIKREGKTDRFLSESEGRVSKIFEDYDNKMEELEALKVESSEKFEKEIGRKKAIFKATGEIYKEWGDNTLNGSSTLPANPEGLKDAAKGKFEEFRNNPKFKDLSDQVIANKAGKAVKEEYNLKVGSFAKEFGIEETEDKTITITGGSRQVYTPYGANVLDNMPSSKKEIKRGGFAVGDIFNRANKKPYEIGYKTRSGQSEASTRRFEKHKTDYRNRVIDAAIRANWDISHLITNPEFKKLYDKRRGYAESTDAPNLDRAIKANEFIADEG